MGLGWLALLLAAASGTVTGLTIGTLRADSEGHCFAVIDGHRFRSEAELVPFLRNRGSFSARLEFARDAPYRCIGWIIFAAQRAGAERIGFISEPPPAESAPAEERSPGD